MAPIYLPPPPHTHSQRPHLSQLAAISLYMDTNSAQLYILHCIYTHVLDAQSILSFDGYIIEITLLSLVNVF